MTWAVAKREIAGIFAHVTVLIALMLAARGFAWLVGIDYAEALALLALSVAIGKGKGETP